MCKASSLPLLWSDLIAAPAQINGGSMPEKGPPVYLDYDQAALDAAYDQAAYPANREQLIKRRLRDSELTRLRIGEPERVAYGPAEIERLDIYRTERDAAPVFVFIHGGAWRSGRSKGVRDPGRDVPRRRCALCRA
jgi:arylformamidase